MAGIALNIISLFLPSDKTFWKVYAPVIRILKDSYEHRMIRQKINKYLDLNEEDAVLEEGCGRAVWLSEIGSQVALAIGLDNEEGMLKGARQQAPRAGFVQADLNKGIPFGDDRFTKIGSILVDGYLRNRELARRERYRVLAPGGMMAIVTPRQGAKFFKVLAAEARHRKKDQTILENLIRLPLAIMAVLFGKVAELKAGAGQWHFYEKQELINVYQAAGFEIIACESVYADQAWLLIIKKPPQVDSPSE